MKNMKGWYWVALVLVVIGALNWGFVGLFNTNVVASLFGDGSTLTKLIYVLVGLAGLWVIYETWVVKGKK